MPVSDALTKLVRDAFNEGFHEGLREHTSSRGGNTWMESRARAALEAAALDAQGAQWRELLTEARDEIDHYADTASTLDLVNRIDALLKAPDA